MKKLTYKYVKEFIENEGYTLLSKDYINSTTKLILQCDKGHQYNTVFLNFKRRQSRCPICSRNQRLTYNYIKNFIENEGYTLLSKEYKNVNTELLIECNNGHQYKTKFDYFRSKRRCPVCYGNKKHTYNYVKDYIKSKGYRLLSLSYKNSTSKIDVQCEKGHQYKITFGAFQQGHRCLRCWSKSTSSKGERDVQQFVQSMGINIVENDRTQIINPLTGYNLELDIWIPIMKKDIEYNGKYWHDNPYQTIKDKIKKQQCKQKGIDLLIIEDDKWKKEQYTQKELIKQWLKE